MKLIGQLLLSRCPHCGVDSPTLNQVHNFKSVSIDGDNSRHWGVYVCHRCGGAVVAAAPAINYAVNEYYPAQSTVDDSLPPTAREYLHQAINSRHVPAGAVMLAASAVDAMLKAKGLTQGSLYSRIEKAVEDRLITPEMGAWAHEVRLDANDQRHADENAGLPTTADAQKVIEFAEAFSEFLFVLPARITRGRRPAAGS